ncbi:MAG: DUF3394 domain-containing protein, partial [Pseudomonadota bacterium]|nr:DUF3394 domain-containing protein [Pseudomonadota bacterium]
LLIGVDSLPHLLVVVVSAVLAMLVFAAATQGFFLTRNRIWETIALLLITFTFLRPGFWWDRVYPPLEERPGAELVLLAEAAEPGKQLRISIVGETLEGDPVAKTVMLPMGEAGAGEARLETAGIMLREEEGKTLIDNVVFGSAAEKSGLDFDQEIVNVQIPTERPPKQLMFIPALLLLALVWFLQRGRRNKLAETDKA